MITEISDIAILMVLAAGLAVLAHIFRQPLVLAYLATGTIIGAFNFLDLGNQSGLGLFSDLGIMLLLFLVGLEINYSSLHHVGKASVIIGVGQLLITFLFGFVLAIILQLPIISAFYISMALTFSSTVVVVKILSEKKDLNSLYGKISLGFLLVQDLVAILILVALSTFENGNQGDILASILSTLLIGGALFGFMFYIGRKILPPLLDLLAQSQELLFLVTLAWLFGIATLVDYLGFSLEIGGLLAGLSLANSSERLQIAQKIRPLRDFFILVFFAILGSTIAISNYTGIIIPIILFSIFVLIGNPLIVLCLMGVLGYRRRTSFMAGMTVAQISEFSLVLATLGLKVGHIKEAEAVIITAVGVLTITISNYLIMHSESLFHYFDPYLRFFERKKNTEHAIPRQEFNKPIILIGAHRTGQSIAIHIPKSEILIIDFDPRVIQRLKAQSYDYLFGDIADEEILNCINFKFARVVVSTTPSLEDNLAILVQMKEIKKRYRYRFHVVVRAKNEKEMELLYAAGADYVLLPHFTAGGYFGQAIAHKQRFNFLKAMKDKDIKLMNKESSFYYG